MTGFADLHLHQFAEQGFGGRVLWGSASAEDEGLRGCRPRHGPHGLFDLTGGISRIVLGAGNAAALLGHPTDGWPEFPGWPRWDDLTHQSVPLSGLRRAVEGGLRLAVVVATNNELLGRLTGGRGYQDMTAVDRQLAAARQFEAGPGRGWYRICHSAGQARETITAGRLAVVLGVEVDGVFLGSRPADLEAQVSRYHALGVRHVFPIHLRDNAYGGAAFALGLHWSRRHPPFSSVNPFPVLPVYRMDTSAGARGGYDYRAGHTNRRGLSPLGSHLIRLLMSHHMMIDVDHMSAASRADTLRLAEEAGYPVVAGHTELLGAADPGYRSERLLTDDEVRRIGRLGGIVAPLLRQLSPPDGKGARAGFRTAYRHVLGLLPGAPVAYGSDLNGFAGLPRPGDALEYPFTPPAGAPLRRSRLGERLFDLGADGVAHVGLVPDFLAGLGLSAAENRPLLASALGYADAWARAGG
jgi:microsomal dipeptidase-like Zn-dependent dipeptidase